MSLGVLRDSMQRMSLLFTQTFLAGYSVRIVIFFVLSSALFFDRLCLDYHNLQNGISRALKMWGRFLVHMLYGFITEIRTSFGLFSPS